MTTPMVLPRGYEWDVGCGRPPDDLRRMRNLAPFVAARFWMNARTMLAFLDNHWTVDFAVKMGAVAVLEKRQPRFTFPGLGDFAVGHNLDGIVCLVETNGPAIELVRLVGAVYTPESAEGAAP